MVKPPGFWPARVTSNDGVRKMKEREGYGQGLFLQEQQKSLLSIHENYKSESTWLKRLSYDICSLPVEPINFSVISVRFKSFIFYLSLSAAQNYFELSV